MSKRRYIHPDMPFDHNGNPEGRMRYIMVETDPNYVSPQFAAWINRKRTERGELPTHCEKCCERTGAGDLAEYEDRRLCTNCSPRAARNYKPKHCWDCGRKFKPKSGATKLCAACVGNVRRVVGAKGAAQAMAAVAP